MTPATVSQRLHGRDAGLQEGQPEAHLQGTGDISLSPYKYNLPGHLLQLLGGRVGQAEHDHVDAVGVADEVVVGEVVPLAPGQCCHYTSVSCHY